MLRPMRFSPMISPQSAAGGWSPSPTKLRAATSRIAVVSRSPKSTRKWVLHAWQDLRRHHIARTFPAGACRFHVGEVDDLERGRTGNPGNAGRRRDRDREDDQADAGSKRREEEKRQDQGRERERKVGVRPITSSTQPRR